VLRKELPSSSSSSGDDHESSSITTASLSASIPHSTLYTAATQVPSMSLSELNEQTRQQRARLTDLITQVSRPIGSKILDSSSTAAVRPSLPHGSVKSFALKFTHVKGHSNNVWNDYADQLASRGKLGVHCSVGRYASHTGTVTIASIGSKATRSRSRSRSRSPIPTSSTASVEVDTATLVMDTGTPLKSASRKGRKRNTPMTVDDLFDADTASVRSDTESVAGLGLDISSSSSSPIMKATDKKAKRSSPSKK
jgi:hypothetical protein